MSESMEASSIRATERYIEISGPDQYGRAKTHVVFTYSDRYSDGTSNILQEVTVSLKPIVSVFKHAGYVNVLLDFHYRGDADLAMVWNLLEEYQRPVNSVDWLPEELESGKYMDADGNERLIHFPMLELSLSLKGKELDFVITGMNPLFFTLQPNGPKGEPCVLQLVFHEDWFFVTEDLGDSSDLNQLRDEVMQELGLEMME